MKCPYCSVLCYFNDEEKMTVKCANCRSVFRLLKEKNLMTTYKLFRKMLIRLAWSYTCTKYIPKTELEQTFYRSNDGKGFTSEQVEYMSKVCWVYLIFLNRNYEIGDKMYISHTMLMEEIIYSCNIDKCFYSRSRRPVPYWAEFLQSKYVTYKEEQTDSAED